jgi:hypothetical protein
MAGTLRIIDMNIDQTGGLIRAFMAMFAGWALAHGIDAATWLALTGGVVAVVTALWSLYANSLPKMLESVAKSPEVKKIITTPGLAMTTPHPKVVIQ